MRIRLKVVEARILSGELLFTSMSFMACLSSF